MIFFSHIKSLFNLFKCPIWLQLQYILSSRSNCFIHFKWEWPKNKELEDKLKEMKRKQQNDLLNNKLRKTQHSCELLMCVLDLNKKEKYNKNALSYLER